MSIVSNFKSSTGIGKHNTQSYTPTGDYNPATKKYTDDLINSMIMLLESKFYGDDLYNFIVNGKNGYDASFESDVLDFIINGRYNGQTTPNLLNDSLPNLPLL